MRIRDWCGSVLVAALGTLAQRLGGAATPILAIAATAAAIGVALDVAHSRNWLGAGRLWRSRSADTKDGLRSEVLVPIHESLSLVTRRTETSLAAASGVAPRPIAQSDPDADVVVTVTQEIPHPFKWKAFIIEIRVEVHTRVAS